MDKRTIFRIILVVVILGMLALYGALYAQPAHVDTLIQYEPDKEYSLLLGWDEPAEDDIAYYVLKYREYGADDFTLQWFPISEVLDYNDSTWAVSGELPIETTVNDTTYYELCLVAVDYANNASQDSDSLYLGVYWPDVVAPNKVVGLFFRLVIQARVN